MPRPPRATPSCRALLPLLVGALALVPRGVAAASTGFALERYIPTAPGEQSFWVDRPWYADGHRLLVVGLNLDYAHNPLVVRAVGADGSPGPATALIAHELVGHLEAAASFRQRLTLSLNLPLVLLERGTARFGVAPLQRPALADPRLGAMVRLLGDAGHDAVSVHAGVLLWAPLGGHSLQRDNAPRLVPKVVLGGVLLPQLSYAASLGVLVRQTAKVGDLPAAPGDGANAEVQLGLGASWWLRDRRLALGPEVMLSTALTAGVAFNRYASSVEVLGGAHYSFADGWLTSLAVGGGALAQAGTPNVRLLARLSYRPDILRPPPPPAPVAPRDRDQDGVVDADDACPDVAAGPHPDPSRRGCPAGDADADGVLDPDDLCPAEAAGPHPSASRPGCPEPGTDADGDGLNSWDDQCPELPAGSHPDPSRPGCPLADRDQDGVADVDDACPDVAAGDRPDPARRGCPLAPPLVQRQGTHFVTQPVRFANGRAVILPESFPVLTALVAALQASPAIKRLAIEGHTDRQGSAKKNLVLSQRRAASVMHYLVAAGIAPGRLEAHGFGGSRPVADNKTADGRATNRRVDFNILAE